MKKTLVYILALTSLLGLLSACGAKNEGEGPGDPTPDVTTDVRPMDTPDANNGTVTDQDGILEDDTDKGILDDSNGILDGDQILPDNNGNDNGNNSGSNNGSNSGSNNGSNSGSNSESASPRPETPGSGKARMR